MKNKFPHYYKPTDHEFEELWDNCVFIFDTSAILNLYQYSITSRDEFFSILKKISNRIWIPNQVGKEYHSRRHHIIREQNEKYLKIKEKIETSILRLLNEIANDKTIDYHPFIDKNDLKEKLSSSLSDIDSYLKGCKSKYPDLIKHDDVGEEIDKLFDGKVGDEYPEKKLSELYVNGKKRFEQKIPPGFLDQQKGNDKQFGDYILWVQILEYAKTQNKSIIFVTDDEKKDWWLIHDYQTQTHEIILPHPDLTREFKLETDNQFFMYNSENFIKSYRKFLKEKVSNETIKEVRNIRNQHFQKRVIDIFTEEMQKQYVSSGILETIKQYEEMQKQLGSSGVLDAIKQYEEMQKQLVDPNYFTKMRKKYIPENSDDAKQNDQSE